MLGFVFFCTEFDYNMQKDKLISILDIKIFIPQLIFRLVWHQLDQFDISKFFSQNLRH